MGQFCRRLDAVNRLPRPGDRRCVVKAAEVGLAVQAQSLVEAAREEADGLRETARADAETLREQARRDVKALMERAQSDAEVLRERAKAEAEAEVWQSLELCSRTLQSRNESFRDELESQVLSVLRRALTLLAAEMPGEARLRATIKTLFDEAGAAPAATLHLNEADLALVHSSGLAAPWPMQPDASLPRGLCRLAAAGGDWECSFEGHVQRLLAALAPVTCGDTPQVQTVTEEGEV